MAFRFVLLGVIISVGFCAIAQNDMAQANSPSPQRDINSVLRDHEKQLMAVPGVVGVYIGQLEDHKTSCIKIMLARDTKEASRIPKTLEGYRVVAEVTGEIRPLGR
jgi:hypothetical protein